MDINHYVNNFDIIGIDGVILFYLPNNILVIWMAWLPLNVQCRIIILLMVLAIVRCVYWSHTPVSDLRSRPRDLNCFAVELQTL